MKLLYLCYYKYHHNNRDQMEERQRSHFLCRICAHLL
nr:MAG TPA_asm: hypothetical protein [Caudoviricetes sp.]